MTSSRSYEANLAVLKAKKTMNNEAIGSLGV